ncbi:MAG: DUF4394 domain-containing protein [Gemmataceae bacterium]|nr:DUF4394 domain-containing protein [Gemmataceae bacterium]
MRSPLRGRASARSRPRVEFLEGRDVPALLLGLTTANQLVRFDSATPGTPIGAPVAVTGLAGGENLVGLDYRPATGQLFAVGSTSQVYTVNPTTGAATAVGAAFTPALDPAATGYGVDFNPVADRIRVVASTGQSLRIDPTTGAATADTALVFDPADPQNQGFFGTSGGPIAPGPQVVAVGYTLNDPDANPATAAVTTLYGIDAGQDLLVRIGGPDGTPSPNAGQTVVVDQLRNATTFALVDFGPDAAFDIEPLSDAAYAVTGSALYSVNITTGAVTPLGAVAGTALRGLAVIPAAAGAGTVSLSAATAAFPATRGPLAVTVTRTGGTATAATVSFATSTGGAAGNAVAGVDFLPASGTVTFNPGETSRQIFLQLPAGTPAASPEKTFTLTLTDPTNGATLGATTAATITIPAVAAATPTRFFTAAGNGQVFVFGVGGTGTTPAFTLTPFGTGYTGSLAAAVGDVTGDGTDDIVVGAGPGGAPRITVYDGATLGASAPTVLANFFAYESTFRGGVYVAVGDVNADGQADVIAGTGNGGGPRVQVFGGQGLTGTNQTVLANFFTVESTFRGGVTVGTGEYTGDANADVLAGTGVGGGARVQIFSGATVLAGGTSTPAPAANYLAYADPFRGGVFVAGGDVNGDGLDDVVTGVGSGGGPNVRVFGGATTTPIGSFFAFPPADPGGSAGVRVAVVDPTSDGAHPISTGGGAGASGAVRFFDITGASAGGTLNPFPAGFNGGVFVG